MMDCMDANRVDYADRNCDRDYKDSKDSKDRNSRDSRDSKDRDSKCHKDRDKRDRDGRNKRDRVKCLFCWYLRHEVGDCHKMKAATIAQQQQQPPRQSHNQTQSQPGIICYHT